MSRVQRLARFLVSRGLFARMEAESRTWFLHCPCGWEISVWEAGGIRYKAASVKKKTLGRCPQCNKWRWLSVYRKT